MTGSERPSPEPLLTREASPAVLGGREFWKCSGALGQNLEGEITIFTVLKWGKERNHYENHDLGHNH